MTTGMAEKADEALHAAQQLDAVEHPAASRRERPAPAILILKRIPEGRARPQSRAASKPVDCKAYTSMSRMLASSSTHQIMLLLLMDAGHRENDPFGQCSRRGRQCVQSIWRSSADRGHSSPSVGFFGHFQHQRLLDVVTNIVGPQYRPSAHHLLRPRCISRLTKASTLFVDHRDGGA